jgi:hypothetical protein
MSKANSVEGVLKASLRRVRYRWVKNMFKGKRPDASDGRGQNAYCLVGSVTGGETTAKTPFQSEALLLIQKEIERRQGGRITIPAWNDQPARTQQDVISVVEKALEEAKKKGI